MAILARSDRSVLGRWWWTVDRWSLLAIIIIAAVGILLIQASTPGIALRHNLDSLYFVERHILVLVPALIMIFGLSLLPMRGVLIVAGSLLALGIPLLIATPFFGVEIKGAVRWIHLPGLSIQPSEFIKPALTIIAAWLFARYKERQPFPGLGLNIVLYGLVVFFLLMQPDIGMTFLISAVWFMQFFLAGLPLAMVAVVVILALMFGVGAYYTFPHFTARINKFLHHDTENYQIEHAKSAFANGGLFGTGPGEGTVKMSIPDAHADFIFAVAGEELGFFWTALLVGLFAFIVLRGLSRLRHENNLFIVLAASGLLAEFGLQAFINMASTMAIMPAKGMTLPFISYGGSSLWAAAMGMGMLLALTRKRFGLS